MNAELRPGLERVLARVQKPSRYTGGEYNEIIKDKRAVNLRVAFCFPDTYEVGMSNIGLRILYGVINSMDGVWCERVFAPWLDMEEEMRKSGVPLYALESGDNVRDFDVIAFSVGYEMAYTNILNMLDLAGIPLRCTGRVGLKNLVVAGGTCMLSAEPLADFVDVYLLGEGEELDPEFLELYRRHRDAGSSKDEFLRAAARIEGVYVPSLYDLEYNDDGTIAEITPHDGAPRRVVKRIITDLDAAFFPTQDIVPSTEIIHDRTVLELFRGCVRGCRFCQAGHVYRPVRSKSAETLVRQGIEGLEASGYQEITLSSLSTSDFRDLSGLCDGLLDWCEPRNVSLSLPSLRADNFSMEIMRRIQKVRKSGLTFAPEAGSQRLRDAINKNVTEDELLNSCRIAFSGGYNGVKLYFMMGLPTETDEDIEAIADLSHKVLRTWKEHASNKSRGVRITVSTSCFVPKPHTPFQWVCQDTMEEFDRKQTLLRSAMRAKAITYNWHDAKTSVIEGVLSRGDRRLGTVLEQVWRDGERMSAWSEGFSYDRWMAAFKKCGVDPEFYTRRARGTGETLPWDMIDVGVTKSHLINELHEAYRAEISPDCRVKCLNCGASRLLGEGGSCDE